MIDPVEITMELILKEIFDKPSSKFKTWAYDKIFRTNPSTSTIHLLQALFGTSHANYHIAGRSLLGLSHLSANDNFIVICGDSLVNLEFTPFTSQSGPHVIWTDHDHGWTMRYEDYIPCDPTRRPEQFYTASGAFAVNDRLIYLCPSVLDHFNGRTLVPYKNQVLAGKWLEDYMLVAVMLLHELCHTNVGLLSLRDQVVRMCPPIHILNDPSTRHLAVDPAYLNSLPEVYAFGFPMCYKLATESPDRAIRNPDSLALLALGLYLEKNDWGDPRSCGCALPIQEG